MFLWALFVGSFVLVVFAWGARARRVTAAVDRRVARSARAIDSGRMGETGGRGGRGAAAGCLFCRGTGFVVLLLALPSREGTVVVEAKYRLALK